MTDEPDKLLATTEEAARHLSASAKTLENWRAARKGPPSIRLAPGAWEAGVRYPLDKLKAWHEVQQA